MPEAPISPIPNFRDVGGHRTTDGRRVRTGQLYRSVAPPWTDDASRSFLLGLGIRTVLDLRTDAERAQAPAAPPAGIHGVVLDVLADSTQADPTAMYELMADPRRASAVLGATGGERFFLATYRDLVTLPSARRAFAAFYRVIAEAEARPALVHCTTGKDRTGWAVAVLLLYLGVPEEAVMADYLRSDAEARAVFAPFIEDFVARGGDRAVIEPFMGVRAALLEAALERMRTDDGSVEGYLRGGLGLAEETLDAIGSAFLEPG